MSIVLGRDEPVPAGIMISGTVELTGYERWNAQRVVRSYHEEIIERMRALPTHQFNLHSSGRIVYGPHIYDTMFATVGDLQDTAKPLVWLNAQIHGYEEGASQGLFAFAEEDIEDYVADYNFVIDFC